MKKGNGEIDRTRICHNCSHHYDEHDKALDGHMILCRCPFFQWCRIQYSVDDACEHFKRLHKT